MTTQNEEVYRANGLVYEDLGAGVRRHIRHGHGFTQVRLKLQQGAVLPLHRHPEEQYTHVITGRMDYTMADGRRSVTLEAGDGIWFPPMVAHGATALEPSETFEVFVPGRPELGESPLGGVAK